MATIIPARSKADIDAAAALIWEWFDLLRSRYPEMRAAVDDYIESQDVAGQMARFEEVFLPPHGECYLALHEAAPVGLVCIKRLGATEGEMNRMFVRQEARGLGLGKALCQAAIQGARDFGFRTLFLDAAYKHVEALPLYEAMGFVRYEDKTAFRGDDARVIHMRLVL